jgi:hypothetical protein
MKRKLQNILSFSLIALYILAAAIFQSTPQVGRIGLAVLVLGEVGISAAYCLTNRALGKKELWGEIAYNAVLTAAAIFLVLSGVV